MKYKTDTGVVLEGTTPTELINSLREGSRFAANQDLPEFMQGMADRYKEWDHSVIRTDTHENFIKDLMSKGYIIGFFPDGPAL